MMEKDFEQFKRETIDFLQKIINELEKEKEEIRKCNNSLEMFNVLRNSKCMQPLEKSLRYFRDA